MKKQKIITYLCLLGATFSIASCDSQKNSVSETSTSTLPSESTSLDNSSLSSPQTSESTSNSLSQASESISESLPETSESASESTGTSSDVVIAQYSVTFDYNGAYDNETISYNEGDIIDLSQLKNINDSYDCIGWTDGTNEYGIDDKITVTKDMTLVGNYVKKSIAFELSNDGSYYIASQYLDIENESAVIPDTYKNLPVKEIKEGIFENAKDVKTLTVGNNVEKIAAGALTGLNSVESITIPFLGNTLEDDTSTLGYLFGMSGELQSYVVPETLKNVTVTKQEVIPTYAFANLSFLETVHFENAKTIKRSAFYYMNSLTTIELNEGVEVLEKNAFYSLSKLVNAELPSTVRVYDDAFSITGITSLHFTNALQEYSNNNENRNLESITVDSDNELFTSQDGVLYNKDCSELITYPANKQDESFTLLDSVTTIGKCAFKYAHLSYVDLKNVEVIDEQGFRYSHLKTVTLPQTIKSIGLSGFSASSLEEVTFPATITNSETLTLGNFVFSSCEKLAKITVPSYVVDIPEYFITGCTKLDEVKFLGSISSLGQRAFAQTLVKDVEVTFKNGATIGDYPFINCETIEQFIVHFEDGVTAYPTFTNKGFGKESTPTIMCDNAEVAAILKEQWKEYELFINTAKPSPFVVENNVLVKFNGTDQDVNITIPEGITRIAKMAFSNNRYIQSVVLPASLQVVEEKIFNGCSNLKYVRFAGSLPGRNIEYFENGVQKKLSSLSWPNNTVLFIVNDSTDKQDLKQALYITRKEAVFTADEIEITSTMAISADKTTLIRGYVVEDGEFVIPGTVTAIHSYCFSQNSELTTIDFTNIETIGEYAFNETSLVDVVLPDTVTSVGASCFESIETLESIKIEGAVSLADFAFASNEYLQSIDLGDSIVSIGSSCFAAAAASADDPIALVVIPSSIEELGETIFEDAEIESIECGFSQDDFDCDAVFDNFGGEVSYSE